MSGELTNDVPLSSAEIAGYMNWRGPGAYTVHAERRIKRLVAEAVRREREACAKVVADLSDIGAESDYVVAIRARGAA